MTLIYSVIFALSLLLALGYYLFARKKKSQPWLLLLYLSISVVQLGYLLLSCAKTLEFALAANKLAYLGQVLVPLCMFMLILQLCGYSYKKWVPYALLGAAMLMLAAVLTTGHLDWYYKSVTLSHADGAAMLVKEYGFLHPMNLIYVLAYFVTLFVITVLSLKKQRGNTQKLAGLMLAVVVGNVGMWIVEKLVTLNFEFLSVSYLMSECVFFFVYWMLLDAPASQPQEHTPVIVVESMERAEKIEAICQRLPAGTTLSQRQTEVLEGILDGKSRREIAADLHLSENTVKMHTASLYRTLGVSSREEIRALLKM